MYQKFYVPSSSSGIPTDVLPVNIYIKTTRSCQMQFHRASNVTFIYKAGINVILFVQIVEARHSFPDHVDGFPSTKHRFLTS
jgi:hypothetical protein